MSTLPMTEDIEIFWMPGCSSCLRLKEFVEKSGKPFTAINVEAEPERAGKLLERGMRVPALCVGNTCVNGVHLATVAELIGVPYVEPERLEPSQLREKYRVAMEALCRLTSQIDGDSSRLALPGRERTLIEVAGHAACVMRYFLGKFDDDEYPLFFDQLEPSTTDPVEVVAFARETFSLFETWWAEVGQDDDLEAVVPIYWGHRTLHEALEREVWHTAQHTRQVAFMLEQANVVPDGPLTPEDLSGLPVPDRVFD